MDALLAPLLAPWFMLWGSPVTALEVAAFGAALAMVALNMRVNPWAWPLAIFSSVAYALLFADARLYGEAGLQGLFIAVSLWGWWQWLYGRQRDGQMLRVRHLCTRGRLIALALTLTAWPLLGTLLARATDSDVPYWDAFATVASVTGQWLLARKYVDNWPVWVVVNVVSVTLFAYKGLWLTVALYALFAVLALIGWRAWRVRAA